MCRSEIVSGLQADGRDFDRHSLSKGARWGPVGGRLNGPGGMARRWHAWHSEGASMFSLYMMLHVLFFLGLLLDVKRTELCPLSASPSVDPHNGTLQTSFIVCHTYNDCMHCKTLYRNAPLSQSKYINRFCI